MLDLLSDFLDTETTVEEKNCVMVADRVLQRADMEYEHVIEEILSTKEEMDSGAALVEVLAVYRNNLIYLLDLHAIKVREDLSVKQLADIVNGLLDIDNVENPEQLFKIADEEARPIEKLATMLGQVTTWATDELMMAVEEVSETFFRRLKDSNQAELHDHDDDELHQTRERVHAFRKFDIYLTSVGGSIVHVPNMLQGSVRPGMTFELYAKLIDGMQPILSMPGIQIARELFAAALISSDGYGNPGETVKACLEQFIPDLKLISDVMVEVRKLTMGYSK
jgi:hypothetical protein